MWPVLRSREKQCSPPEREHLVVEDAERLVLAHPGTDGLFQVVQRGLADRRGLFEELDLVRRFDDARGLDGIVGVCETEPLALQRREAVVVQAIYAEPGVAHAPLLEYVFDLRGPFA